MYTKCLIDCLTADVISNLCKSDCAREYQENLAQCPCQPGCPNGCPCPVYECPATTTHSSTTTIAPSPLADVLVLFSYGKPTITNSGGKFDTDFHFKMGEGTEVYKSCSFTWRGEHYVVGGENIRTQVSKIIGCELTKIGSLEFEHRWGACTNVDDQHIYLCFPNKADDYKKCRKSTSPTGQYQETSRSTYEHPWTRIANNRRKFIYL